MMPMGSDLFEETEMMPATMGGVEAWRPRVNVAETDKDITVHAELPGVAKEDIKVDLKDDVLTISGERRKETKEEDPNKRYTRVESSYGYFERQIPLPEGVDPSQIKAQSKEGVLEVQIPKPQTVKGTPITVE